MKQFVKKITFFSLPLMVGLIAVFFIKTDREFCYNYVKGDCEGRGKLLYKKIYGEKNTVDYLFIGSSKTWNDIDDDLLENLINKPGDYHYKLFNAGYCRFGRNLDYLYCKEFLKRNRLKKIFLEVRADESTTSHPIYPYLATGNEVLEGALALNGNLFSEIYNHLLMNINYSRCRIKIETPEVNSENPPKHGYSNIDRVLDENILDEFYANEKERLANTKINPNTLAYRFSDYYLNKIKNICDKKKVELVFIYLAGYANINKEPAFKSYYEKWGKVILAPDSIYTNKNYWKDVAHLNSAGANAYTKFLATQLAR